MGMKGIESLGNIVENCKVENLDASECALTPQHLEVFEKSFRYITLKNLTISENYNIGVAGMATLGKLIQQNKLQKINISRCDLTAYHLENFKISLRNAEFKELDISFNQLGATGCEHVMGIVKDCKLNTLRMRSNQPLSPAIFYLFTDIKIKHLDISSGDRLNKDDESEGLLPTLISSVTERLELLHRQPSDKCINVLQEALNEGLNPNLIITFGDSQELKMKHLFVKKSREIGSAGGNIEVGDCRLIIPERALTSRFHYR
ncbi:uncharacterized protein LOC120338461 isoform X3 [Styela clava]